MSTTNDVKNPHGCSIRRAENGWIMANRLPGYDHCGGPEHVFPTAAKLADFIRDNFKLEDKEDAK